MDGALRGVMPAGPLEDRFLLRWLPWLLAVALHLGLFALWPAPGPLAVAPQTAPAGPAMQVVQLWPLEADGPQRRDSPAAPPSARGAQQPAEPVPGLKAQRMADPVPARAAGRIAAQASSRASDEGPQAPTPSSAGTGAAADSPAPPGAAPARGEAAAAAVAPPATAAPAAAQDGPPAASLLDAPATRQALRAVAAGPSARAQSDAALGAANPLSAEERLARDVARAGHGDCLKGEFFGGGAGLLSLPFWVAAQAQGKCRR